MIIKTKPNDAPKVQAAVDGRIMHSDDRIEAILLTLKPGDEIPLHKNPFDVLFAGIEGSATLVTPSEEFTIEPSETIFLTSDEDRAWNNQGKVTAIVMVFKILK